MLPKIPCSKRVMDLLITSISLVLLLPVMLLLIPLVWIFLGSPVFFRQQRPGYKGRPFSTYKFRTMTNQTGADGKLLADAQRLTPFGKLLRATSLDDLPQLFNVMKGEMSLVGPRPLLMRYLDRYTNEQMRRHDVLPGITGWAQIHGRNMIDWEEKFNYDLWYVDHWSLWLDIKILLITPWKVFKREGVSPTGQATMEEFKGPPSRL